MNDNRIEQILKKLSVCYPNVEPELDYSTPFELLIATILSAQCTDARVNQVTKKLFKKYKFPVDYISVTSEELENDIFSLGFYRQKTKSIKNCCQKIIDEFDGEIPETIEELINLPGVGRKTASVVAGNAYGIPAIAVDTHVSRVSNLLGLVNSENPEKIESELKKLIPKDKWISASHWLIMHGRYVCIARRPKCNVCVISDLCPSSKRSKK